MLLVALLAGAAAAEPYRVTFPDGKPRFELLLAHGLPNGPGRGWYENGTLAFTGTYVDGARQGLFLLYDERGAFVAQVIYFGNAEVWRSSDRNASPPDDWKANLVTPSAVDDTSDPSAWV